MSDEQQDIEEEYVDAAVETKKSAALFEAAQERKRREWAKPREESPWVPKDAA